MSLFSLQIVLLLAQRVKQFGEASGQDIWSWTGYAWGGDDAGKRKDKLELLSLIDIQWTAEFDLTKKEESHASSARYLSTHH